MLNLLKQIGWNNREVLRPKGLNLEEMFRDIINFMTQSSVEWNKRLLKQFHIDIGSAIYDLRYEAAIRRFVRQ